MALVEEEEYPLADLSSDPEAEPVNLAHHTFEVKEETFEETKEYKTKASEFEVEPEEFPRTKRKMLEPLPVESKKTCCDRKCIEFLEQISSASKQELRRSFQCNKVSQKNLLLSHLWSTSEVQVEHAFEESDFFLPKYSSSWC